MAQKIDIRRPHSLTLAQARKEANVMSEHLKEEFGRMAGKSLLITGGAGFLGYYLVLAAVHFNRTVGRAQPIHKLVDPFAVAA